jgi:NitT/TauT family transport system ATP-binding protein
MDEPFSALDVLTAVNLRSELLNLWGGKDFPTKAILIVTHNIEEAVQMADRIFVLSSNPGRFKAEIDCTLARPRDRRSAEFEALVDRIYGIMTEQRGSSGCPQAPVVEPGLASPSDLPLPHASVGGLAGLLEILNNRGGRDDLPELGRLLTFEVDDLLPIVDAAEMLGFAKVADADIELTAEGKAWVEADILTSKEIFAATAREQAPLVRAIVRALETTKDGTLNERFFFDLLQRAFSEDEARAQLNTAVNWGRYAELFDYHADDDELVLTAPANESAA